MTTQPASSHARWTYRVVGVLMVLGGIALVMKGGGDFLTQVDTSDEPPLAAFGILAAGMFTTMFGLAAINAGFLGAQARYAAHETAPAVRTIGAAWRGATPDCPHCGGASRSGARFCDACGHAIG